MPVTPSHPHHLHIVRIRKPLAAAIICGNATGHDRRDDEAAHAHQVQQRDPDAVEAEVCKDRRRQGLDNASDSLCTTTIQPPSQPYHKKKKKKRETHESEQYRNLRFRRGPICPRETSHEYRGDGYGEDDLQRPGGVGGGFEVEAEGRCELHGSVAKVISRG
jgi:hypothetical protein